MLLNGFVFYAPRSPIGNVISASIPACMHARGIERYQKVCVTTNFSKMVSPIWFNLLFSSLTCASPVGSTNTSSAGELRIATYNVAGLPSIINSADSNREKSSVTIGERIGIFDIVNMQEDFNYHAYVYSSDQHKYRTATSGGAGIGSGLNTVSKYSLSDLKRVHWHSCQFDSGDCFTPKGFTFVRTELAENVEIDLYNLHANAGDNLGDEGSRGDNLSQLQDFVIHHSQGKAVVIMGDTNTRYTRTNDTIAEFADALNLTDAWVKLERGGDRPKKGADPLLCGQSDTNENTCEVVDKIFYRVSQEIDLNAVSYQNYNSSFLNDQGIMLSDHSPIGVTLQWHLQ